MEIRTRGGLTFTARVAGPEDGRPVLLLHGFPETSRCWQDVLAALGLDGHRAVAVDQRGYSPGARPAEVSAYKPDLLVGDVLDVADALGWDRFDLVGHDFGGTVAWMVAGHHPDRVATLTVASTPHPAAFASAYRQDGSDQRERSGYMRAFREAERGTMEAALLADGAAGLRSFFVGVPTDAVDAHVAVLAEPGALVAAFDWYRAMSGRASAATPPSSVPTLYLWADADPAMSRSAAEATADLVTGPYRFVVLEGAGHWVPELAPDRVAAELLAHLAAHPSRLAD